MNIAKYTILPVPTKIDQIALKSEKKIPTTPIIAQTSTPAKGVARNF
jgi:hypothetical protein